MKLPKKIGDQAEDIAVKYLRRCRYKILARNLHNRFGEIDIIALDKNVTVFIEVNYRHNTRYGHPQESVTSTKLARMHHVIDQYIKDHHLPGPLRIDVISLTGDLSQPQIEHIPNITV